jgi:hypothetical protein
MSEQTAVIEETSGQRAERVIGELELSIAVKFVPWSQSRNKNEDNKSLNWTVTVKRLRRRPSTPESGHMLTLDNNYFDVLTTGYTARCGHCPAYKNPVKFGDGRTDKYLTDKRIATECETGFRVDSFGRPTTKAILPDTIDVLYSLVMDSDVLGAGGFEDWAANYGYDVDSRKAESTYRACLENALKLRAALGDDGLSKLREAFQDY